MDSKSMTTRDPNLPAEYSAGLDRLSLAPLWTALHALLPQERVTQARPHRWRWAEIRGPLLEEGRGAFTTVDGVRCAMEPGDLIITPPMRWHDHGHEGTEPVIWLDGLDIPLVRGFEAAWASKMRPAEPPATACDSSQDELTAAGMVPRASRYEETGYPQVRWPWSAARKALEAMAAGAPAGRPVILRYVNPRTGDSPLRTMGCEAQWLRPGEATPAERRTASGVFHVIEGRGESRIGEETISWEQGDCVAVPPWHWVQHKSRSASAPACLFHFNDEPAVRALGLYLEETPDRAERTR